MLKYILCFFIFLILAACSEKTIYSGKIINQDDLENINFKNKENLLNQLGYPSFIDPIENKFFYYSEKRNKKSVFKNKINYSYVFVFKFNSSDLIISTNVYDLKNAENLKLVKDETSNEIIQRGLIERIFGGVGPQQITNSQ